MFSTLESNWDQSAHRGRATLVSFTIQTFGLSLLIAISVLWVGRPPQVHWLQIGAPVGFAPAQPKPAPGHHASATAGNRTRGITAPRFVPHETLRSNDARSDSTAPDAPNIDYGPGGETRIGVSHSIGDSIPVVIPARPTVAKPLLVSHLSEANLLHRVQPTYPALARQARIQGAVELRAIISKTGTIENLVVVRGHPMLATAAVEAVRQWRYRPYLLNGAPIEVETDITVNFLLSGG
jgi:periplasmic protein TonB